MKKQKEKEERPVIEGGETVSKLRVVLASVLAVLLAVSQILAGPVLAAGPSAKEDLAAGATNGTGENKSPVEGRDIVGLEGLVDDQQGRLLLVEKEGTLTLSWPRGAKALEIVTTKGAIAVDVLTEGYELVLTDTDEKRSMYSLTGDQSKGEVTLRFQQVPAGLEELNQGKALGDEQPAAVEELVWLGVDRADETASMASSFAATLSADSSAERIILDASKATIQMPSDGYLEWILSSSASRKYEGSFTFELSYDKEGKVNGITLQNKVKLRDYLEGVVPYESQASWPIDALKAQAVAARTFVAAREYNVVDSTAAQVYRGIYQREEYRPKVEQAVRETAGEMIYYKGDVANTTVYSSSNGGYREESRYAFSPTGQGAVLPYLPGGKDEFMYKGKGIIPEEYYSKDKNGNYKPPEVYAWERLIEASLIEKLWPSIGTLKSITIIERTPKGRGVTKMELAGSKNKVTISGHEFRSKIGADVIRSTYLKEIMVLPEERKVRVKGGGFGHRAGMSQHGAAALANLGIGYKEILSHYYPGTQLVQGVNDATKDVTVRILDGASRLEWMIRPSHTVELKDEKERTIKTLEKGKTYILTPVVEQRVAGANRYETAALISKNWPQADVVILARGDKFADALAGVPLAHYYQAPILLTEPDKLNEKAQAEIKRLKAKKVIILGGTEAIGPQVEAALQAMKLEVERLSGQNRYETALKIAEGLKANRVIVVNGQNFPDSISAAPIAAQRGYPIILTPADRLEEGLQEALAAMNLTQIYIVGGEAAVSAEVEKELASLAPVKRNAGSNRYKTNIAVIKAFLGEKGLSGKRGYVATGNDFADALTGGALAAREGTAVILVGNKLDPAHDFLKVAGIKELVFFGGEKAVSNEVAIELIKRMSTN